MLHPARRAELPFEVLEVGGARSAPAVDRLVGIAHRHHRVVGEELGEHPRLDDARVLVLVEQHYPVAVTELGDHRGHTAHDLEGEGDLVGVFDEAAPRLGLGEPRGELDEHRKGGDLADHPVDLGIGPRAAGGEVGELLEAVGHRDDARRVGDVLAEGPAEGEDVLRECVDRAPETRQPLVGTRDHDRPRELPGGCLAEDGAVALPPQQDRVVAEDGVGERVVGRDGRRVERVVVTRDEPAVGELGDPLPDPRRELARRLAREGEAEDLPRRDVAVREEPQHPVRHRLGLATAGAGDDERRGELRLDHGTLLVRRTRPTEGVGDVEGANHSAPRGPGGVLRTGWRPIR